MDCLEFRRFIAAMPRHLSVAARAHREQCPRCADAHHRALAFESMLDGALAIPVPSLLVDEILLRQITAERAQRFGRHQRVWQIAAGIALTFGMATVSWLLLAPTDSLAAISVEHLKREPVSLLAHDSVAEAEIRSVFAAMGVSLIHSPGAISYLRICPLGDHRSIHMVMPKPTGAVTVLFVPNLSSKRRSFVEDGMLGREISMHGNTLVMLANTDSEFDTIESSFAQAVSGAANLHKDAL